MQGAIRNLCIRQLNTRRLAWILLSSAFLATCQGQEVIASHSRILVNSDLVVIPVTVTDRSGKVVAGLQKEHFVLFEDDVEQVITHFSTEDAPASIGFVFDTSDSMAPKLQKAREAVAALLNESNKDDEFFLVQFSTIAKMVVPMTSSRDDIWRSVESIRVNGSTALLDGVTLAMKEMKQHARHTRKAIIIISDGEDNSSHCSLDQFKATVREGDALIYSIGITSDYSGLSAHPQKDPGAALLREISEQTGGRLIEVQKLKQLRPAASRIGEWLRSQYVLGYVPQNAGHKGEYHRIQLKLIKPKGFPRLTACWRIGYYEPAE